MKQTAQPVDRFLALLCCAALSLPTLGCLGLAALTLRAPHELWPLGLFLLPALWGCYTAAVLFADASV